MKLIIGMITLALSLMALTVNAEAKVVYHFANPQQSKQFKTLVSELRCLVCQNENIADSNADLAKDLRAKVYTMVKEGQTNQQIKQYMVSRYGDFVLFKPPVNQETLVLWFLPLIVLLVGLAVLVMVIVRRKKLSAGSEA